MKLITKEVRNKLVSNFRAHEKGEDLDPKPALKLFVPWGAGTWLFTELDEKGGILFGLCDLGMGFPELGYASLEEIEAIRGPGGLRIERDMHFRPSKTLSQYSDAARDAQRIVA